MKIKVKPEDFTVIEEAKLPLVEKGNYKVYKITKWGFNTIDLLLKLSKKFHIPFKRFSYGGKKDRYGLTTQYITIEDPNILEIEEKNYTLKYIGDMNRPMGPDLIIKNTFMIKIRDLNLEDVEYALNEIEIVKDYGYTNYFDDQRFGSYSVKEGFIGEKIIKRHYNGALKIYLTAIHPYDKKEEKERKKFFLNNWGNWHKCLEMAKTDFEKYAFTTLINKIEKPFLKIIQRIPKEELSMFFSAFQSYIWNLVSTELVKIYGVEIIKYRGNFWNYIFYRKPTSFDYLKNLYIPTISQKLLISDELIAQIYNKILKEFDLKTSSFNLKKIRKAFFSTTERPFIVIPEIKEFFKADDELYTSKKMIYIHFKLPRGSYGTMLIKRIMAR